MVVWNWAGPVERLPWPGVRHQIGRAGLRFARAALHADSVISFTERHNVAPRRVMERLDMVHMGEITARGLVDGQIGEADDAPFAVYLKQVAARVTRRPPSNWASPTARWWPGSHPAAPAPGDRRHLIMGELL